MIKAALFDLDGVLIDTEKYYMEYWQKAAKALGYDLPLEKALLLRSLEHGKRDEYFLSWFGEDCGAKVQKLRQQMMQEATLIIEPKPGAKEILEAYKKKYLVAVVTASPVPRAKEYLTKGGFSLKNIQIISAKDAARGKPYPDPYLLACSQLGIQPKEAIAFEDSNNGARSAIAAGIRKVYFVPDLSGPDGDLEGKVEVLSSLQDLLSE